MVPDFAAMDVLLAIEHLPSLPRQRACDYDRIIDWLERQPDGDDGGAGHALERLCLEALRTQNSSIFWTALLVAGWGRILTRWSPRDGDLAHLVEATARALARRWRTAVTVAEAADLLGYSDVHVRRLIRAGRLRADLVAGKPRRWEIDNDSVYKLRAAA